MTAIWCLQKRFFDYIEATKKIDSWLLEDEKTELINNHLTFWSALSSYYDAFTESLLKKGVGYQGLMYREAVEHLESYIQTHQNKLHVFMGFNALNKAESIILQELLNTGNAKIYWDP